MPVKSGNIDELSKSEKHSNANTCDHDFDRALGVGLLTMAQRAMQETHDRQQQPEVEDAMKCLPTQTRWQLTGIH